MKNYINLKIIGTLLFVILLAFGNLIAEKYLSIPGPQVQMFKNFDVVNIGGENIIHWENLNVGWYLNSNGAGDGLTFSQTQSAVQNAFDSWENVNTASIMFNYMDSTSSTWSNDGKNVHYWAESGDSMYNEGYPFSYSGVIAVTIITINSSEELLDVDIVFNGRDMIWRVNDNDYDIEAVSVHEIGHMLGLAHSEETSSTMYYQYQGIESRSLEVDDKVGISFLYRGNLISSETFSGTNYFNWNLTVLGRRTLTISPGATLKFASNTNLTIIRGILNAVGSPSNKITFERSGTTGNWGSIIFDLSFASSSILDNIIMKNGTEIQCLNGANVTIQNSTLDHNIQGIYVYNSAPLIINNQINEPRDNGIHGEASGLYIVVKDNTITKTDNDSLSNYHNFEGIRFTNNTSSEVIHNDISGFYWGGYFGGGDNINFGTNANNINNRFLDNLYGFASGWGSTVLAGDINGIGGYNTAFNNSSYDVYSYQESNLEARYNYWGGGQPNSFVDGTSTLIITNVLTTDPWGGAAAYKNDEDLYVSTSSVNTNVTKKLNTSNNNNFADISAGIGLEKQGKINEAVNHYKKMIKNDNNVRFALTKLVNFIHKYSRNDILNYLKSLSNNSKYSALITKLIADIYLQNNQFNDAINAYNSVINNHSDSFQGINSRFEKMFAYLHIKKDKTKAKQILSEIKSMNLTDDIWNMRIKTAEHFLGNSSTAMIANSNITLQKNNTEFNSSPDVYTLFDNYPNPFNPTTTISYSIPKGSFVTLTIYDVLGREVKTLVNKFQTKGKYNYTFNARNLTSGVYIYRIKAGDFAATKKLVLMK